MRVVAALFLSLATTISAQVAVDEHEQTYGPFEPGPVDRAPAVAVAPHGMLLAWSEIDPKTDLAVIHTGLLDFDAKLIGEIHTLPTTKPKVHATTPAVVFDGKDFFVAWLERERFSFIARDVTGVLVDGTGKPLKAPSNLGDAVPGAPSLIWNGLEFRAYSSNTYAISTAGDVRLHEFGEVSNRIPFATTQSNGWIDWSNTAARPGCSPFLWCGGLTPIIAPPAYFLDFAIISYNWVRSGRIRDAGYTAFKPAVLADGEDLLLVWGAPKGLKAARIDDGDKVRTFEVADARAADAVPALAGSLVVFERLGDIFGVTINGDSFGPVFPISAGEEWDSAPRVYGIGPGRYFVTYIREVEGPDIELAGRFVTIQ